MSPEEVKQEFDGLKETIGRMQSELEQLKSLLTLKPLGRKPIQEERLAIERANIKRTILEFILDVYAIGTKHDGLARPVPHNIISPRFGKVCKKFGGVFSILRELQEEGAIEAHLKSSGRQIYLPAGTLAKLDERNYNHAVCTPEEFRVYQQSKIDEKRILKAQEQAPKTLSLYEKFQARVAELRASGMGEAEADAQAAKEITEIPKQQGDTSNG